MVTLPVTESLTGRNIHNLILRKGKCLFRPVCGQYLCEEEDVTMKVLQTQFLLQNSKIGEIV